ncbi:MAG: iron ABC transporter permease [Polyangiaceae bacterium]|nr:iron ABC transporter permease [Polyangiaceae bacterium]
MRAARRAAVALACAVLAASFALALLFGSEDVSLAAALRAPGLDRTILFELRLPRAALTVLAGGGLGLVGAAFQAILRNPLAEPYVLGVSGGAALGATTVIALGLGTGSVLGAALTPLSALAGGLGATLLVYGVARRPATGHGGATSGASILLAGVMVNAIAAALVTFAKSLVPPARAQQMLRWLTGFIELPNAPALAATALYVLAGALLLWRDAARMNLLGLGAESAELVGVDVRSLERRVFVAASAVVGAIVCLTGLIGFVGLLVPHAARRLVGPDHRVLLPLSFLGGGAMLLLCDLGARLAFRWLGSEPPVGAVTALLGGPLFLALLARRPDPHATG